jgi:hypothetical protein
VEAVRPWQRFKALLDAPFITLTVRTTGTISIAEHDRRVTELLESNNRFEARAREAERALAVALQTITKLTTGKEAA